MFLILPNSKEFHTSVWMIGITYLGRRNSSGGQQWECSFSATKPKGSHFSPFKLQVKFMPTEPLNCSSVDIHVKRLTFWCFGKLISDTC